MPRGWSSAWVFLGVGLAALLIGLTAAHWEAAALAAWVEAWLRSMERLGWLGWLTLAVLQLAVTVSGVMPASMIGVIAGAVYGLKLGFALAALGTVAGAMLALAISRTFFRNRVERALARRSRLQDVDRLIREGGWRFVCVLRLSPVMPFAAASYVLGLSGIRVRDYTLGTLASLPALFGYVGLGVLSRSGLAGGAEPLRWVLYALGIVATVALTPRVGRLLVRAGLVPRHALALLRPVSNRLH